MVEVIEAVKTVVEIVEVAKQGIQGDQGDSAIVITYTVELDFGAIGSGGSNEASVTITDVAGITATSQVIALILPRSTTATHSAADHEWICAFAGLTVSAGISNDVITVLGKCIYTLTGQFKVHIYLIG